MYKESSNRKNNPGDLISDEPQKAPCCTQDVRAQSVFFHGSSDCSGQLAQTPWPTTRGRGLLRPDWVSLAVKSFNDLAQFFAIKNFSAARHIRVYTKHVHMLQLLHELFHLLLAVRAEAACATASASSWASRSGSSNTRRTGATAAASRSSWANRSRSPGRCQCCQSKQLGTYWGLRAGGWAGAAGGRGTGEEGGAGPGAGGRGLGLGLGDGGGGWDLGLGTGRQHIRCFGRGLGAGQKFLRCTSHTCLYQACPCASVASRLFHLLLAVRAEAACATASGSSWASRSGSSNNRRAGATAAASKQPVPVLQVEQLGAYWGLRAGGWAGAGGRELGPCTGGGRAGLGAGWGWGLGGGGWVGLGVGARGSGRCTGAGGWDTAATQPRHTRTLRERFSDDPWSTIGPLDPNL